MGRSRLKAVRVDSERVRCTCAHCGKTILGPPDDPCHGTKHGCMHGACCLELSKLDKDAQGQHRSEVHARRSAASRAAAAKRLRPGWCPGCGHEFGPVQRVPTRCPVCRAISIPEGRKHDEQRTESEAQL